MAKLKNKQMFEYRTVTKYEYGAIARLLGRTPTQDELFVFDALSKNEDVVKLVGSGEDCIEHLKEIWANLHSCGVFQLVDIDCNPNAQTYFHGGTKAAVPTVKAESNDVATWTKNSKAMIANLYNRYLSFWNFDHDVASNALLKDLAENANIRNTMEKDWQFPWCD